VPECWGGVGSDGGGGVGSGGGGGVAGGVLSFSWHGQQHNSSSQLVFVFTTIGTVTGLSSSLVDVGSGEVNDHTSSCFRLR
jgi:hypothetical protein